VSEPAFQDLTEIADGVLEQTGADDAYLVAAMDLARHEHDRVSHFLGLHQAAISEGLFHLGLGPVI